jgi:hypothetical protein
MVESSERVLRYIVEHYEEELSEWTLCEYTHMVLTLGNLYNEPKQGDAETSYSSRELLITNFRFVDQLAKGTLKEDDLGSKKNTERFVEYCKALNKSAACYVTTLSF